MKKTTAIAYSEINAIFSSMDEYFVNQIPLKIRNMFKENQSKEYKKEIIAGEPLKNQNLTEETLNILAVLNYNYWCKDEELKKELLEKYKENEQKYQEELNEKYSYENLFKGRNKILENDMKNTSDSIKTEMIEYKEKKWYEKIFEKIMRIFRKN